MRRLPLLLLPAFLASSCDWGGDSSEKARSDAQDVARVEAAQNAIPPVVNLVLQGITAADIAKGRLAGPGCAFLPEEADGAVVALARDDAAYVKADDDLRTLAADKGSSPLPFGAWMRYEGREHVMDLQVAGGEGASSVKDAKGLHGRLTIRDPYDRIIYSAPGIVSCGA